MNDNVKMLGRYAISAGVAYAAGKGWLTPSQASALTSAMIDLFAALAAVAPALYAAFYVSNKPKEQ